MWNEFGNVLLSTNGNLKCQKFYFMTRVFLAEYLLGRYPQVAM